MKFKSFVRSCYNGADINCENYLLDGILKENPNEKEQSDFAEVNSNRALFAVSSGALSEASGEEAAYMFSEILRDFTKVDFEAESKGFFAYANDKIADRVFRNNGKRNAAEAAVLYFNRDSARVYCVGDAVDVFVCNGETVKKLSEKPKSRVGVSYDEIDEDGRLKVETVTRPTAAMLGVPAEKFEVVPYVSESVKMDKNTQFLLCSRAVTENVGTAELERVLMSSRKSCEEKANALIDIACKKNSEGCYTAEIVQCCGRGVDFKSGGFKVLVLCVILALVGGGLFAVGDAVFGEIGSWFESFKSVHGERGEKSERSVWTPLVNNVQDDEIQQIEEQADSEMTEQPDSDEQAENATTVQTDGNSSGTTNQGSASRPIQSTAPASAVQKPVQSGQNSSAADNAEEEPLIYNGTIVSGDAGVKNSNVELPIDFGE